MAILFSTEISKAVEQELKSASNSVQVITAYCKINTFKRFDSLIPESVKDRKLLVRFRLDDILKGSTDFGAVEYGIAHGWSVFIRFDLHAKTFIIDNKRSLIGSANVTNSGMNFGQRGNMEMATMVEISSDDIVKIYGLFRDAIMVDNALLLKMKNQLDSVSVLNMNEHHIWSSDIIRRFNPHIETLFSYELPESANLEPNSYFSFIDAIYTGNVDEFRQIFRWSNAYLWLMNVLEQNDGCLFFGELTSKLHMVLVEDPKPYRKDVKTMLSNLLLLIEKIGMNEIVIDRPNHSQRVMLTCR